MYPDIGMGSVVASVAAGVVMGLVIAAALQRAPLWVSEAFALVAGVLAPFLGQGTWVFGFRESATDAMSGIHFQYAWTALAVVLLIAALRRIKKEKRRRLARAAHGI